MIKKSFEMLGVAGLVAGLMLSPGCRTTYSEQATAEDLSLRPMPESLAPEATGDVVPLETPEAKPIPYWKLVQQQGGADADPYATSIDTGDMGASTPAAPSFTTYVVKNGDTVSHIAVRYGLRWQDIAAINSGLNVNRLRVGQKIRLPGTIDLSKPRRSRKSTRTAVVSDGKGSIYIVKRNDILGRIARAHGVRISDIKRANNLKSDFIREGQKLVIPVRGSASKSSSSTSRSKDQKKVSKPVDVPPPPVSKAVPSNDTGKVGEDLGIDFLETPPPVVPLVAPPVRPPMVEITPPPPPPEGDRRRRSEEHDDLSRPGRRGLV